MLLLVFFNLPKSSLMMKLFVSYRRKSWGFARELKRGLRKLLKAEIFLDFQDVDETDFERSILRHLHTSDVVLVIVTEYTFSERIHREDDWVRREIREALRLNKPIIVVFVDGQSIPGDLPRDIADIRRKQGVNFYPEYFDAALFKLAHFIDKATPVKAADLQAEKARLEKPSSLSSATSKPSSPASARTSTTCSKNLRPI